MYSSSYAPGDIVYFDPHVDKPEFYDHLVREAGSKGPFIVDKVVPSVTGRRTKHPQTLSLKHLNGSYSGHLFTKAPK